MSKQVVYLLVVLFATTVAHGQESVPLKQTCEQIIIDSIRVSIDEAGAETFSAEALHRARLAPIDKVKDLLAKGLANADPQVRFIAAELLAQKSPMEFEATIRDSLNQLDLKTAADMVRRSIVLMKLGDEKAKKDVEQWAMHQFEKLDLGDWACPMMCVKHGKEAGKCPVCGMEQRQLIRIANHDDWEARLRAVRALQDSGQKVGPKARSILVSDAMAHIRLHAAGLWAKENPEESLPHIKIYVQSDQKYLALMLMADHAPKECVDEFANVIENGTDDLLERFAAHRGLLKAGETKHLAEIRDWVDQRASSDEEELKKFYSIHLLGELASDQDIRRLEKLLDTKYKVVAAVSLLGSMAKQHNQ